MLRLAGVLLRLLTVAALLLGVQAASACVGDQPAVNQALVVEAHQPDEGSPPTKSDQALPHHHGACHDHQLKTPDISSTALVDDGRTLTVSIENSDGLPLLPPGARLRPPIA
jgi:hypothetical protein